MSVAKALLMVLLAAALFVYGLVVGRYKVFPYHQLRTAIESVPFGASIKTGNGVSEEIFQAAFDSQGQLRERTEWAEFYVKQANIDKPRILFIGDSIVNQYYEAACVRLSDFSCAKFTTSASIVNNDFTDQIGHIIEAYEFAYVLFNNGLHGFGHTEAEYEAHMTQMVDRLDERYPGRLALVESTPIHVEPGDASLNERLDARNRVVHRLAESRGLPVSALHSVVQPTQGDYRDRYHHTERGIARLADAVVAFVETHVAMRGEAPAAQ